MCTSAMIVCSPINNSKGKEKKTEEQIASIFRRDSKQDTIQRYHLAGITFVAVQKYQVAMRRITKHILFSTALGPLKCQLRMFTFDNQTIRWHTTGSLSDMMAARPFLL